ncbi:MAG: hypothetical protein JWM41_2710 [Gemmatimonadetes bacterium]|nr:hypothetical protein [Gemmatimonadota bacterium]
MSNVAKLKKQAAELEQKKQFDKALAVYVKLLESFDQHPDELDVALFNRVGDLMLRQGNVADAVDYYEQAVDRYADTGFFNNAIALCNKILRHSPGRASVYYKLGKISAQKGFKNDAKANFLEYADRMQKAGKVDEAFRALKEFADLVPDQHEIRLMLADQLMKADRRSEAVDQLQTLYERYESEGRSSDAVATVERMRAIDPSAEPRTGTGTFKSTTADLVFLDLDTPTPRYTPELPAAPVVRPPPAPAPAPAAAPAPVAASTTLATPQVAASDDLRIIQTPAAPIPMPGGQLEDITRVGDDVINLDKTPSESLLGLESTRLADDDLIRSTPSSSLLDIEPTSLGSAEPTPMHRSSAPTHAARDENDESLRPVSGDLELIVPPAEPTPVASTASIDFDLSTLTTPATPPPVPPARPTPNASPTALDGLPLMDLDVPPARTPAPRPSVSQSLEEISATGEFELIGDFGDFAGVENAGRTSADTPRAPEVELLDLNAESLTIDDDEPITMPTPSIARRSTMVAVQSMEILKASVEGEPGNWPLRRELAEAMLDAGEREAGIRELETAMAGAEHGGDLELASALAEEIARLEPELVKHHQKRVEYAFRTNDRGRLIEAYLSLADALLRSDQADKARTVYQRVIDLAPDELRARSALEAIIAEPLPPPEPAPQAGRASGASNRRTTTVQQVVDTPAPARAAETFVNLGDWLRDDEAPKDTRMVVAEQEPSGDEEADFADMLRKFKQGVAENVDAEDYQSHYDLAIAYKEMGLLDEAISQFQKALGSPTNRVPTYEALGQCFLDKGQYKLASSILSRALSERANEEQLVGVLYLLGLSAEAQGLADDALGFYQRVFVLDIQFRDIADRLNEVERGAERGGAAR